MQVFTTSTAARVDRGEHLGGPRAEDATLLPFRRVEPDPFVTFSGVHCPRSELVRAGIRLLD
ncbi:MAG: hypothetical protein QM699_17255 [Amaricoccus sp.]|uniref:hypothetical protein n=1 Tax=Amaricoccus sp. TaxID=1872485 RepID=UPI0039E5D37D